MSKVFAVIILWRESKCIVDIWSVEILCCGAFILWIPAPYVVLTMPKIDIVVYYVFWMFMGHYYRNMVPLLKK